MLITYNLNARSKFCIIAMIVITHVALLARGAFLHAPTVDEVGHLVSGLSHWENSRFDLFRVNPPLVRLAATLPAFLLGVTSGIVDYDPSPWHRPEFDLGQNFIQKYGEGSLWIYQISRWACIPFSIIGAFVCYHWSNEIYGNRAALIALALWSFSPTVLAHGQLLTPDVGSASLGVAAAYAFRRWLAKPSWRLVMASGLLLGLALTAKFTLLIFLIIWPIWWLSTLAHRASARKKLLLSTIQIVTIIYISIITVNAFYLFENSFEPIGSFKFVSKRLGHFGKHESDKSYFGNPLSGTTLGNLPTPFPANYIQGIDVQLSDFERKHSSYLRGTWKNDGWYYYYVYSFVIKENLLFVFMAIQVTLNSAMQSAFCMNKAYRGRSIPFTLSVVIFVLVSAQIGFNHHYRYVLPALPFLIVFSSGFFEIMAISLRLKYCFTLIILVLLASLAVRQHPNFLSYFNELAGGPSQGFKHLANSNLDWGQDLLFLKKWSDDHADARPLEIVYSGSFEPSTLRFWDQSITFSDYPSYNPSEERPDSRKPFWVAIFIGKLQGPIRFPDHYADFRHRSPDFIIGGTVLVYKLY